MDYIYRIKKWMHWRGLDAKDMFTISFLATTLIATVVFFSYPIETVLPRQNSFHLNFFW